MKLRTKPKISTPELDDGWVYYIITSPTDGDREGIYYNFRDAFIHKKERSDVVIRLRATHTFEHEFRSEGVWEEVNPPLPYFDTSNAYEKLYQTEKGKRMFEEYMETQYATGDKIRRMKYKIQKAIEKIKYPENL